MAAFFDRAGTDKYQLSAKPDNFAPADRTTHSLGPGGLFVDE